MKKIEAVIQPNKLEEVKKALSHIGVDGMTVSDVSGHGRERAPAVVFRGASYKPHGDFLAKVKVEIFVPDHLVHQIIGVISDAAMSGEVGDGKIFVSPIDEAVRIRNGDRGDEAL